MKKQITYKDLNGWLKTLVVLGWITCGISVLAFIVGFIEGYMYY